ncbi:hypothetical protein CBL_04311 [Carabus blaptoides fortunei]
MSSSLTDEEKTRLVFLLSDITNKGQFLKKPSSKPTDFKNAFKFNELEKQGLKTINTKLKTLQEMCDDANLESKSSSLEQNENRLAEEATELGEDNNCHEWEDYRQAKNDQCQQIDNELDKLKEDSLETEEETILCNEDSNQ